RVKLNENSFVLYPIMKAFLLYFIRVFRKDPSNQSTGLNLRMMHGINRVSIIMFAFALLVMLYRALFK
ncbi:MAG: DUF6728 family protein, partial [Bacteroidota bacterium]